MLVTRIFSFSHNVLKVSFFRGVESRDCVVKGLTHYQTTNFRLYQTEFADYNFKFDKNRKKVSKSLENIVGKGEIACYEQFRNEQFLLFPQCFQKACFPGASKGVIVWEWVKKIIC